MATRTLSSDIEALPAYLKVQDAAKRLNIGRSLVYDLMGSGRLRSVSINRCRRIPRQALLDYEASLTGGDLADDSDE